MRYVINHVYNWCFAKRIFDFLGAGVREEESESDNLRSDGFGFGKKGRVINLRYRQ